MTDQSAVMTLARFAIVQLRLNGMILGILSQSGTLTPETAAELLRSCAAFLDEDKWNPEIVQMLQAAIEQIAADLEGSHPL